MRREGGNFPARKGKQMRIPGFNKPKAAPEKPVISAPIPGSMLKIVPNRDGSVPANPAPGDHTGMPHNEYPHNRPVPNNLLMRREGGGVELLHLPQGASLVEDEELPRAHA